MFLMDKIKVLIFLYLLFLPNYIGQFLLYRGVWLGFKFYTCIAAEKGLSLTGQK
jgi:hypothetical protein